MKGRHSLKGFKCKKFISLTTCKFDWASETLYIYFFKKFPWNKSLEKEIFWLPPCSTLQVGYIKCLNCRMTNCSAVVYLNVNNVFVYPFLLRITILKGCTVVNYFIHGGNQSRRCLCGVVDSMNEFIK